MCLTHSPRSVRCWWAPAMEQMSGGWSGNVSHLCYTEEVNTSHESVWCRPKDECSQQGMILPLFIEVTWNNFDNYFHFIFWQLFQGHLASLGQDHPLPDRPPLQLRGRLYCGGHLHVLHRLHHLHHQAGHNIRGGWRGRGGRCPHLEWHRGQHRAHVTG